VLLDVKWRKGATGRITPVGIIEPVIVDNALISKVNLHSYKTIKTLGLAINDTIMVARQGGSVPKIVEVIYDVDKQDKRIEIKNYLE